MIVEVWTGAEVRALRDALRMTQEQFAELIGWATSTIRKWEQHATPERPVRGSRAADLDSCLASLTPEQARRFVSAVGASAGTAPDPLIPAEEDDVKRRDLAKLAAFTAVSLPTAATSRISMDDVHKLNALTIDLDAIDQLVGGADLVEHARRTLERSLGLLNTAAFDGRTAKAWMSAVGNLAIITGWLAYDGAQHALARRCYSDALSLAACSEDDDLTVHALLNASLQTIGLARTGEASPSYALALVRRAADLMRRRPPGRIQALISVREAAAHGVNGDGQAFQRAMAVAWREMDEAASHEPLEECQTWLRFVTHAELRGHEARGWADTGNSARALALYEVSAREPARPRNSAHARAWFSAALARTGDTPRAVHEATSVLADLEAEIASTRTLKSLNPVRTAAGSWAGMDEFVERFDALARSKGHVHA